MFRIIRTTPFLRQSSSKVMKWPTYEQTMVPKNYAERLHAVGTTKMWFWFNIFLTVPALIATVLYTVPPEVKHINHLQEHPSEWLGYAYMRKRTKPTHAWGDNSLFHSDYANALPPAEE